jgi:hypothetical protein
MDERPVLAYETPTTADAMNLPAPEPPPTDQRPWWQFVLALVVVLAGVALGTLLIIPRADRGRVRPAISRPTPFIPATNQIIAPVPARP